VSDVLQGFATALASPPLPEAGAAYAASRAGMLIMLVSLAAQEAERGPAATLAENAAIRSVFNEALAHDAVLGGRLSAAGGETEADFTTTGLDAANARLRRLLIGLHEHVEAAGDTELDRRIVALYGEMARGRRLQLPAG
jgi:hypothetical protein